MSTKNITDLTARQVQSIKQVALMIAMGESAETIQSTWERFIISILSSGISFDANTILHQVICESYTDANADLQYYAEKVKFFNEIRKAIREEEKRARELLADIEIRQQSLDDSIQLAALELQKEAEKHQEFVRFITDIQGRLSDTAREIIDNFKK